MKTRKRNYKSKEPNIYDEMTIVRAAKYVKGISRETAAEIVKKHVNYVAVSAQGGKTSIRFTWGQFLNGLEKWRDNNPYGKRRIATN